MSSYIEPLRIAVFIFPFLALLISVPFFVRQYRRYGRFTLSKGLILYSFVFYLLCAYFLVILPLPAREAVSQMTGARYQLQVGQTFMDFLQKTVLDIKDPSTYIPAIRQSVFLEPLFNVLLFFPLGVYLRYYFKLNWKKTLAISFGMSLFFELTQLSGLYFYYSRPYRLFDVNDLINNSFGGMVGYVFTPVLTFMLPTRKQLDDSAYEKGKQVTLTRRVVAMVIDWMVCNLIFGVLVNLIPLFTGADFSFDTNSLIGYTLEVLLYFVLFNYLMKGQTIGKKIVKIRVVQEGRHRVSLWALFKRYGLLYVLSNCLHRFLAGMAPVLNSSNQTLQYAAVGVFIVLFGLFVLFILNLGISFLLRKRVLFYEKASHTHTVSTLTK